MNKRKYDRPNLVNRRQSDKLKLCPIFTGIYEHHEGLQIDQEALWDFAQCRAGSCEWFDESAGSCAVKVKSAPRRGLLTWLFG